LSLHSQSVLCLCSMLSAGFFPTLFPQTFRSFDAKRVLRGGIELLLLFLGCS
jgi:hypothetical protein